ncbi:MAG: hypothetical protein IKH92_07145, partial [Clostridiales bacterium]|nr:hypothetical protein [Clostridiales bacterium]
MGKTRKEELLAEMKALDGRTRSSMDSFSNVERLGSYILRNTFNGVERRKKKRSSTMKDVIKFYETEAELHDLDLKAELEDFCSSVKEFNAERESLWQATRTETKFMLKLINYVQDHNARVLFHQTLKAGDVKRRFNAILITKKFVMI